MDGRTEPGCRYIQNCPGKSRSYFRCYLRSREIGRIQGRQVWRIAAQRRIGLIIQGPFRESRCQQRTTGMYETEPADVQVKIMKGHGPRQFLSCCQFLVAACPRHSKLILI